MKPFNLERALNGDPVVTRDGRTVKIGGYNPDAKYMHQVLGWVEDRMEAWSITGECMLKVASTKDLFMAPKKHTISAWVNIYDNRNNSQALWIGHRTKELADKNALSTRVVGCIQVTYEFEE